MIDLVVQRRFSSKHGNDLRIPKTRNFGRLENVMAIMKMYRQKDLTAFVVALVSDLVF